jgi:hypothetical protein
MKLLDKIRGWFVKKEEPKPKKKGKPLHIIRVSHKPIPFIKIETKSAESLIKESRDSVINPCRCGLSDHAIVHETNDLKYYVICEPCGQRIDREWQTRELAIASWNRSKYSL